MAEGLLLSPRAGVLVPGATLRLRMAEPRELALVGACGRSGAGFGMAEALCGAIGTEAVIEDFGAGGDGVLALRVRGGRRFGVRGVRERDDGLAVADVAWLPDDPDDVLRPEHGMLATLLERILEQAGGEHARAPSPRMDEAAWVGWRLAELLPISDAQRRGLLRLPDPHRRLDRLLALVSG